MVAEDYAWAIESYALSLDFCLTFVRGLEPDEVIARLGGADPVPIVSAEAALGAAEAVQEWADESGGTHSSELDFVAVTRAGDSARTLGLVPYDRALIDLVADAEPTDQRRMAVWAARYCCTRSGLIARDWAEAGLDALENGDPPPPWFADHDAAFARLFDVPRESITHTVSFSIGDAEPTPRIDPEILAMHTVVMARDADPLIAAMDSVRNAVALDPDSAPVAFRAAFGRP